MQKVDGLTGAFVIRQPKEDDPNKDEYDFDLPSHVIVINDWYHMTADSLFPGLRYNDTEQMPVSYLINGRGVFFVSICFQLFTIYLILVKTEIFN